MAVEISVFDVDRTLTRLPTYSRFLLFAAWSRAPWRLPLIPLLLPALLLNAAGLLPRRRLKVLMHLLLIGAKLPRHEAVRLANAFAQHLVDRGLYAQGVALIAAERAAGRRIVLATAAPHFYVSALASKLGIDDVVATRSDWRGDHLRAGIDGENCYGPAKCMMLAAFLDQGRLERSRVHIRFYSDHASDLPAFDYCDEPFAVNPSKGLRQIADRRGWPVIDWRGAVASPTS